jgi:DNA replicative helicase MCM subunit Mcm2 (Cdc46/Mcm family)
VYSRQIRTIIRLALALAKTEGVQVNKTHLERTISVALQFAADLENAFE